MDGCFPFELIIEVLTDVENRSKWESQILEGELIHRYGEFFSIYRLLFRTPIISNRDFVEKLIAFQVEDSYYIYSSSIPDTYCPKRSSCTRGYNLFSVTRMQRVGNKIIIASANQRDIQATLGGFITLGMVGSKTANSITEFHEGLNNRLRFLMNSQN